MKFDKIIQKSNLTQLFVLPAADTKYVKQKLLFFHYIFKKKKKTFVTVYENIKFNFLFIDNFHFDILIKISIFLKIRYNFTTLINLDLQSVSNVWYLKCTDHSRGICTNALIK